MGASSAGGRVTALKVCTRSRTSIPRIKTGFNICIAVASIRSIGTPLVGQIVSLDAVLDDADDATPRFIVNVAKGVPHDADLVAVIGHFFGRRVNLRPQMRNKVIIDGGRLGKSGWDNLILCNCCFNSSVEFFRRDWLCITDYFDFPDISTGLTVVRPHWSENRR